MVRAEIDPGRGPPFISFQFAPPSTLSNTPRSVAAYRRLGVRGSITSAVTDRLKGRPELKLFHVAPPSTLL
jgi:hypothetical protein